MTPVIIVHMSRKHMDAHSGHAQWTQLQWSTKYTVYDTKRLGCFTRFETYCCQFFCQIRQIYCAYKLFRCLHLQIWQLFVDHNDRTDHFTPCACTWGNNHRKVNCYWAGFYFSITALVFICTHGHAPYKTSCAMLKITLPSKNVLHMVYWSVKVDTLEGTHCSVFNTLFPYHTMISWWCTYKVIRNPSSYKRSSGSPC